MDIQIKRVYSAPTYTIGKMTIDGFYFCDTLEDTEREIKIPHSTCIKRGIYKIILNYSQRFKRVMPLLLNVPEFEGIRIHAGNSENDTSGCILVGRNSIRGKLTYSKPTFEKLFKMIKTTTALITVTIS